jgi:hypothetical protein
VFTWLSNVAMRATMDTADPGPVVETVTAGVDQAALCFVTFARFLAQSNQKHQ